MRKWHSAKWLFFFLEEPTYHQRPYITEMVHKADNAEIGNTNTPLAVGVRFADYAMDVRRKGQHCAAFNCNNYKSTSPELFSK